MNKDFKLGALIIGAGRSGTTSLFEYLSQHPDINNSRIKEVHFFSFDDLYAKGVDYLSSFFKHNTGLSLCADTYAMMDDKAPERVAGFDSDIKIIVMLREPGVRAFSNFRYARNFGYEDQESDFMKALLDEPHRLKDNDIIQRNNRCHLYGSLYAYHLKRWVKAIGKEQIFIGTLENLIRDPQQLLSGLFAFLSLPDYEIKLVGKKNASAKARSVMLEHTLLNRNTRFRKILRKSLPSFLKKAIIHSGIVDSVHRLNRKESLGEKLPKDCRKYLDDYFRQDLEMLDKEYNIRFNE